METLSLLFHRCKTLSSHSSMQQSIVKHPHLTKAQSNKSKSESQKKTHILRPHFSTAATTLGSEP